MLKTKHFIFSVFLLGFFSISSICAQSASKKRYIERKSIKLNISELALADIPIASRMGISYEFLLDRNYGIMVGMAYLGYPISMWGKDSLSRVWRSQVQQQGYNFDVSFRHYFDDADESSYYISTYFSTSRLWVDSNSLPEVLLMKKDRVALVLGYQKKWRSLYIDLSGGLGVKFQNWKTHLRQTLTNYNRLSPDYNWGMGWNFEFNKPTTSIAVPIQLLVGFRF
ncbi:MAG: hypothetical protein JNL70_27690 [Saprospiraceae bacterium]|nr:hypothetical protein [Saprospiraceae bacterium]